MIRSAMSHLLIISYLLNCLLILLFLFSVFSTSSTSCILAFSTEIPARRLESDVHTPTHLFHLSILKFRPHPFSIYKDHLLQSSTCGVPPSSQPSSILHTLQPLLSLPYCLRLSLWETVWGLLTASAIILNRPHSPDSDRRRQMRFMRDLSTFPFFF